MGLLDRLLGSERRSLTFDRPASAISSPEQRSNNAIPLTPSAVLGWLSNGPTDSGEVINDATALACSTVYACVRVLSESVASLPLKLYERTATGRQEAVDSPLYRLLAFEPNAEMSAFVYWETQIGALALTGNCYAEIQRSNSGDPVALWPLHPRLTDAVRLPSGDLAYQTTDGLQAGKTRILAAKNVLHCPLFCFDGLKGLSPIEQARQAIGLSKAAERFGARFFGSGSRPGGILTVQDELTPEQKAEIARDWQALQGGHNQGKTAVLEGDWKYQAIGLSPEEATFVSTRMYQRSEICGLFRLPPHMVGDTSRLSNSNHEQESLSFVTDTLRPYLSRLESEITRKLFPAEQASRYVVQFDLSERLRGDFATTMAGYATGKQNGWYSINEIRRELGENPIGAEGDVYSVQVNLQNAKRLLSTESIQDQPVGAAEKGNQDVQEGK